MSAFHFTRLVNNRKERYSSLGQVMNNPGGLDSESWLLVGPHDDDVCLGAGLWLQAARQAGVAVRVLIVTDGRMGYCALEQRERIVQIRQAEALASFEILGLDPAQVTFLGYPDNDLFTRQGRRQARAGEATIAGYTGLQNAFTAHLRQIRPQRAFLPAPSDLHPDHQITYNEFMISVFHAAGAIWPELGQPLSAPPLVYEMAIYCDFDSPPNLELKADQSALERKLESIAAYRSQAQIEGVVAHIRQSGPYEYLREFVFPQYSPDRYKSRFA